VRKAENLPPSCAVVTKSGSLNFLELSGPLQACNGTDLTFITFKQFFLNMGLKKNISKIKRMAVGIAVDQKEVLIFT
jgi:hypothetical protein